METINNNQEIEFFYKGESVGKFKFTDYEIRDSPARKEFAKSNGIKIYDKHIIYWRNGIKHEWTPEKCLEQIGSPSTEFNIEL